MNPTVRENLFRTLRSANIPEALLMELMAERRSLRDAIMQTVLPIVTPINRETGWMTTAAKRAYDMADEVLRIRDRMREGEKLPDEPAPVAVDSHAYQHAVKMQAARVAVAEVFRAVGGYEDACNAPGADTEAAWARMEKSVDDASQWLVADAGDVHARTKLIDGEPPTPDPVAAAPIPHDFETHRSAWRAAILKMVENAAAPTEGTDDRAYWRHELKAYDAAFAELLAGAKS